MNTTITAILQLIRVKQWIKNLFVLAPLVFSGSFTETDSIYLAVAAALAFCLVSSSVYIFNDIHDIEQDKRHAEKSKTRPLARGDISVTSSKVIAVIFLLTALVASYIIFIKVFTVLVAYVILMTAYTYFLKQQPVFDIFTIAIGFVMRVYAGAVAIEVPLSTWMFITTLALALYLAAIKRRQELQTSGLDTRNVLQFYSEALLTRYAEMSAVAALVFYSLYVVSEKPELALTVPIVLFGIFRYWLIVEKYGSGESPTDVLFKDFVLMGTIIVWVTITTAVLSGWF